MRKQDIEFHGRYLAVNVKVYRSWRTVPLPLDFGSSSRDGGKTWTPITSPPDFDHDWLESLTDSQWDAAWEWATMDGWEQLQAEAEEVFGDGVKVWSEGRSGGWAVVDGLPDVESWDAIAVARWSRFASIARAIADDVPRAMLDGIYHNVFEADAPQSLLM